jgi:putative phage-type endonuclease
MNRLLKLNQIKQKTNEWYKIRKEIITATDVSTILECNKFETKKELLNKKLKNQEPISNDAMSWGNFFEDIASSIYSKINNIKIEDVGLIIHSKYNWLGSSPDGIMENDKLIEIKCPYSKKIFSQVPINYWIQTQIQMEVCNIEETILFVCAFDKDNDEGLFQGKKDDINWSLIDCKEFSIKRDKQWFSSNFKRIKDFYNDMNYYKSKGLNLKRKRINTRESVYSKKLKIEYKDWDQWKNLNSISNFYNNDTILDWLNMYGKNLYPKDKKKISHTFIENKSKEFKKNVFQYLKNLYPDKFIEITNQPENYLKSDFYFNQTIDSLNKYPIIMNGILHNEKYKLFSKIDLIINKEYFNLLTGKNVSEYDFILIKIEYSTNKFIKETDYINSSLYQRNYMHVLNDIFEQKNINTIGGLLGYKSNLNNNCFQSIGLVKKENKDLDSALSWLQILKQEGNLWSINPPTNSQLYPNMKNYSDYPWHNTKKVIAEQINEITQLTNCSLYQRKKFHEQGIFSLQNINNNEFKSPILDINFNSNQIFLPEKVNNNYLNWKNCKKEIYIDFETVNDIDKDFSCFPNHINKNYIFMIGIGYNNNGKWNYYNLTVDKIDMESELNILQECKLLLQELDYDIMYHWSNAEINFLKKSNKRHGTNFNLDKNFDLLKLFKNEPITIKGLFDYKLKNVIKIMNQHNLINIKWDEISDGLEAMILTWKYNKIACKNNIKLNQINKFKSIIDYNEIDCKSMFEIVNYLKHNHI